MLKNIQAVIVDLDGTMVDTLGDFEVALNRMLADVSLPPVDRAFIEATVGKGSEHLIRSTLDYVQKQQLAHIESAQSAIKSVAYQTAWASYQSHYLACNGEASAVYPGVLAGLQTLRNRGLKLACLTNKPLAFAKPLLKTKGLDGFFSHIFGGDSFEKKKPDPLPLIKTCEVLGAAPQHTLMIGDSSNDAQAAHAAHCPVVLMTYGYNHGHDIRATPAVAHLSSLQDIDALLG
ncbi:phosphoglycolate phosphatase [Variovorax sp. PCZ-1]|uniref:phosphoglycolate phosphatase n=1 Tax=Variovorax sp. PCZ-1 TaxID=2835533 RepID=UPI001BCDDBA1|nr:phosphoglycolate phosphatase [Variovorax sp. PCZ-1]MBS7806204.1 phosphoglycolate phosphatase [Variovorax sp. PCZ-1]